MRQAREKAHKRMPDYDDTTTTIHARTCCCLTTSLYKHAHCLINVDTQLYPKCKADKTFCQNFSLELDWKPLLVVGSTLVYKVKIEIKFQRTPMSLNYDYVFFFISV